MSNNHSDRVYTSGEVAKICGVSADTVSRWFDSGHIKGYRLGPGGDRRIPHASLREFMIAHGIPLDRIEGRSDMILAVDDDPAYLDILSRALSSLDGFQVVTASTGFDAGALVVEHNPRLLILDINLSDMDGRTVCRTVKSRPETQLTRVLAISGYIEEHEFAQLKDDGFDDHLKKPFSIDDLRAKAEALLTIADARVARPTPAVES